MTTLTFPPNFQWGVSASAYQIEGACRADGKGPSIWDTFTHREGCIFNGDNGDVACDHYHRMPQDVALMKELGIPLYSFTIAWTRILPEGRGRINPKGLDFYDRLVDTLLEAGIRPKSTLYHWDLPQRLQDLGGWVNRDAIHWFGEYARIVFDRLADRVDLWATHNEPWVAAFLGYAHGLHAPGLCDYTQAYQAAHHMLMAHGQAVQIYRAGNYGGEIGLILNLNGFVPASESAADVAATQRVHDETHALFLDPVFKGKYPQRLFDHIGAHQPKVRAGDVQLIRQPIDFLGVNYYNTDTVAYDLFGGLNKAYIRPYSAPGWGRTEMGWGIHPEGLRGELQHLKEHYGNPKIFINENGCAMPDQPDETGFVADWNRIRYIRAHLRALHAALEAGANVHGYFVWSFLDNFEWERGFSKRFGMVRVDYDSLARVPKQSAYWFRDVIARNGIEL